MPCRQQRTPLTALTGAAHLDASSTARRRQDSSKIGGGTLMLKCRQRVSSQTLCQLPLTVLDEPAQTKHTNCRQQTVEQHIWSRIHG
jgi:hypothetical protein